MVRSAYRLRTSCEPSISGRFLRFAVRKVPFQAVRTALQSTQGANFKYLRALSNDAGSSLIKLQ